MCPGAIWWCFGAITCCRDVIFLKAEKVYILAGFKKNHLHTNDYQIESSSNTKLSYKEDKLTLGCLHLDKAYSDPNM